MKKVIFYTLNVFILTVLLTLECFSTAKDIAPGNGAACDATSTFGSTCQCYTANCAAGTACECSGGLFWPTCKCASLGTGINAGDYIIQQVSSQVLTDAQDLVVYCSSYGTSNMTTLSGLISDVISAYGSNNDYNYGLSEIAYFDFFITNLSSNERNDILNWVISKGYPGF